MEALHTPLRVVRNISWKGQFKWGSLSWHSGVEAKTCALQDPDHGPCSWRAHLKYTVVYLGTAGLAEFPGMGGLSSRLKGFLEELSRTVTRKWPVVPIIGFPTQNHKTGINSNTGTTPRFGRVFEKAPSQRGVSPVCLLFQTKQRYPQHIRRAHLQNPQCKR